MNRLKSWLASFALRFARPSRTREIVLARRRISAIQKMQWEIQIFSMKAELETDGNLPPDLHDIVCKLQDLHVVLEDSRKILLSRVRDLELQEIRVHAAELLVRADLGVTK